MNLGFFGIMINTVLAPHMSLVVRVYFHLPPLFYIIKKYYFMEPLNRVAPIIFWILCNKHAPSAYYLATGMS